MATVAAIPIPNMPLSPLDDRRHTPILSTIDPSFSPGSLHLQPYTKPSTSPSNSSPVGSFSSGGTSSPQLAVPMGSRNEKVPYDGPGTAVYVRQPTRAQLRENNSVFGSPYRPYYYQDPSGKPFIDIDGKECGPRWIYVDPKGGEDDEGRSSKVGCCIM